MDKKTNTENTKESADKDSSQIAQATKISEERKDSFTRTTGEKTGIYMRSRVDGKLVASLMDEAQTRMDNFRRMIRSMVAKQGEQSNLTLFGMGLNVTPEESARAAQSIAEGGEYSVDAVATRIMDMAYALAGGDSSKIAVLRDGVEKGFHAAGMEFGGGLPSICQDTYSEVMKRFDEWEQQGSQ